MKIKWILCILLLLEVSFLNAETCVAFQDTIPELKEPAEDDTTFIKAIFDLFEEDTDGNIPEIQRSRRKQVNELLRSILQQPGKLQFSGIATASLQAELVKDPTYIGVGSFDIFAFASFGENALLFFDFETIGGNGPDLLIPNLSGLNADAGGTTSPDKIDRLTVLEAWTEFKTIRDIFTVSFGKIDLTNYFDSNLYANDETSQFLSGSLINNPVLPVYKNAPGIRFRTSFINRFYIQYGLQMANSDSINLMHNHIKILETGFKLFPGSGWEANLRIFGYEHPLAHYSQGIGISFDQLIANHFNLFGRYGKNQDKLALWHGIEEAWSVGLGVKQYFFKHEFKLGIGWSETVSFQKIKTEKIAELYFSNQLNEWVFVSPHVQLIIQTPSTEKRHILAGLRLNFTY